MAKLVALSEGVKGKTHELKVDRTTIGRVEDNTFQLAEQSVSSHHCEILLRGSEVTVRDLNSTNGTFINGEKISEAPLKPGQVLRVGQVELRLENGSGSAAPAKEVDQTMVMDRSQRGVSASELEQGPVSGFDTASEAFSKKKEQPNLVFIIVAAVVGVLILGLLIYALATAGGGGSGAGG